MSYTAAVLTISDKGSRGERIDTAGPALCETLKTKQYDVIYTHIISDDTRLIRSELIECADQRKADLILTTGGTGFSPRDVTPEATASVIERPVPGIPEVMRAESCKITPHGCLSRSIAGIRGRSLIINLPGSEKAARENLNAVLDPIAHGLKMLRSEGSAECAAAPSTISIPSIEDWMREARRSPNAAKIGMYLSHNGIVRGTSRDAVRNGAEDIPVQGMRFSYDRNLVDQFTREALRSHGIYYVRVWLNEGTLKVGDDLMKILIGGDIRPHVMDAMNTLIDAIKTQCVKEEEIYYCSIN